MAKAANNGRLAPRGKGISANGLTKFVLSFLESQGVEAWRDNTMGVFDTMRAAKMVFEWLASGRKLSMGEVKAGLRRCYRKSHERIGKPDISGFHRRMGGLAVYVEIKVGKDELSPEQKHFLDTARRAGAIALVARNEDQFLQEWREALARHRAAK